MKNKNTIGMVIVVVLAIIGIYLVKNLTESSISPKGNSNQTIEIVNIDKVVNAPDHYKSFFGVEGTVIKTDESQNLFLLGCEDACVVMPVKYKGRMPSSKSEIIVYGELEKQEDGKYIFQGKEVKTK